MNESKERVLSAVGSNAIRDADRILRQWKDEEKILHPDPNNKNHARIAAKFSEAVNYYEACRGFVRFKKEKVIMEAKDGVEDMTRYFVDVGEPNAPKLAKAFLTAIPMLLENKEQRFLEKALDAAMRLREVYNEAKAHRVLIDGEALGKKLKQCQEDNVKLSAQIADYKKERLNPL